jgi:membrane-bound lytic murein transglycosylase D
MGLCASVLVSLGGTSAALAQDAGSEPNAKAPAAKSAAKSGGRATESGHRSAPKSAAAPPSSPLNSRAKPATTRGSKGAVAIPARPGKTDPSEKPRPAESAGAAKAKTPPAQPKGQAAPPPSPGATTKPLPASSKKAPTAPRHAPRERPASRLATSEPGKPDDHARRALTGRRPESSEGDEHESVELLRLRELDQTLFPTAKGGASGPWPAELEAPSAAPKVDDSGLPPSTSVAPVPQAASEASRADVSWIAALEMPAMPVRLDPAVVRYLTYYRDNPRGRSMLAGWVKRSGRYGAAIRNVLREQGLPEDLLWLALVESGFDATIHSHAGAAGLWQFVPSTGRVYGLTVTRRVDERLDPERATLAAIRHLSDLHTRFGNWELAFAAYNMGYGGLLNAIRKYNTNDYWELRRLEAGLPYETALYVPKIFSIAIAAKNCKVFGCDGVEFDAPEPFGDVAADKVSVAPGVALQDVADAIAVRPDVLEAMNPQLLGSRLPPIENAAGSRYTWTIYVPQGKGSRARALTPKEAPPRQLTTYRVRWGEPTEHIAARFGTSPSHLEKLNDLDPGESARAGTSLFVPAHVRPRPDVDAAADVAGAHGNGKSGKPILVVPSRDFAYPDRKRVFYQAVLGDTLEDVADACGVSAADLRRWNHFDARAALQDGMTLQLFVPKETRFRDVLLLDGEQVETMPVESSAFFGHFVGQLGRDRIEVAARAGDSWTSLAGRHGLSVGMLERINQKSRNSKLEPGEKVVVYARRRVVAPVPELEQDDSDDEDESDSDDETAESAKAEDVRSSGG